MRFTIWASDNTDSLGGGRAFEPSIPLETTSFSNAAVTKQFNTTSTRQPTLSGLLSFVQFAGEGPPSRKRACAEDKPSRQQITHDLSSGREDDILQRLAADEALMLSATSLHRRATIPPVQPEQCGVIRMFDSSWNG